jgi:hypothetical protein
MNSTEAEPRYFIDLNWYEEKGRSFFTLAQVRLCPSCRVKYTSTPKPDAELFRVFRDCCSKAEDFFSPNLPLREVIFRLLLSSGNQPLELGPIRAKLKEWLISTGDQRDVSLRTLSRIMDNDRYYGFRRYTAPEAKNI